jgi:hypothetical protein
VHLGRHQFVVGRLDKAVDDLTLNGWLEPAELASDTEISLLSRTSTPRSVAVMARAWHSNMNGRRHRSRNDDARRGLGSAGGPPTCSKTPHPAESEWDGSAKPARGTGRGRVGPLLLFEQEQRPPASRVPGGRWRALAGPVLAPYPPDYGACLDARSIHGPPGTPLGVGAPRRATPGSASTARRGALPRHGAARLDHATTARDRHACPGLVRWAVSLRDEHGGRGRLQRARRPAHGAQPAHARLPAGARSRDAT